MKFVVIAFLLIIAILIIGFLGVKRLFFPNYYMDIVLADEFLISTEWSEIKANGKIISSKDHEFISIEVKPPLKAFAVGGGIKVESGVVVQPEIKLVDSEGVEYLLTYAESGRSQGHEISSYEYKPRLPAEKKIERVLLRSSAPIPASRILWSGWDAKDLP